MSKIAEFLTKEYPTNQEFTPATASERKAQREEYFQNIVQISFWNNEYTFQNGNETPIKGTVNSYTHQAKLSLRAMEIAKETGKSLWKKNGMDMFKHQSISQADIDDAIENFKRYGAEL